MFLTLSQIATLLVGVLASYVVFCIFRAVYYVYGHPLRKYPGPKTWAATRLLWVYHVFKGDLIFCIRDLHDKYGPVVRIAPDELAFTSPAAWKDIYGGAGSKGLTRDPYIFPPDMPELPNGIIYADHATHSRIRRQLGYAFSTRALEEQQPLIQGHIDELMLQLRASKKPEDLAQWFSFLSFDLIADLVFGDQFNCVGDSQYHPYASTILTALITGIYFSALNRYGLLGVAAQLLPASGVRKREEFLEMTFELVRRRLATKTERPDFMSYLMKAEGQDRTMTADELTANALILIIAGSESTGSLLAGTVSHLVRHPDKLARATHEVRAAFNSEADISASTVSKLPYMLACLEEGLRICTPAPFGMARRTTEPTLIAGELVPAHVSVSVPQWAAWHVATNFARPDEFLPERWLDNTAPEFAADIKAGFAPFSVGPRNCLGKNLAYLEMRLVMARLLWNFDLALADPAFEWTQQKAYIVWDKKPLMVHVRNVR